MHHTIRLAGLFAAVAAACLIARVETVSAAQPGIPKEDPQIIHVTVTPAGFPGGPLRHRLLPEYLERTPGNAAPLYYRALLHVAGVPAERKKQFYDEYDRLMQGHPSQMPLEAAKRALATYGDLEEVDRAARREYCEWDLRMREKRGIEVIATILTEVQESREIARVLSLRCRIEIAEGRLTDARRTIQTGLQLARDVNKTPTLINSLVGMAIAGIFTENVRYLMEHPDSPNLYWSLTALPRPMIDMRNALEQERSMALQMFPILGEADKPHSREEWRALMLETVQALSGLDSFEGSGEMKTWKSETAMAGLMLYGYPIAKNWLINDGRDREEVEAMPTFQVVALYMAESYHYLWGEAFKHTYLPYPQSLRFGDAVKELFTSEPPEGAPGKEILPIAALLLPAVTAANAAQARTDREIAVLRVLEALRLHAHRHDGRWPKSLDEVKEVPIPRDPASGERFKYRLDGETAVLEVGPPPGHSPWAAGKVYRIKLRKRGE